MEPAAPFADPLDRVLPFEGIHNFRDFGGYRLPGGGRLASGRLWRSGQHHGATDADLERIAALGLTAVYDLRSGSERSLHPCRRPENFAATVLLCADPERIAAPHVAAAAVPRQRTPESTREGMRRNYGRIAYRPELMAMTRRMLADLAAGEEVVLVNCMAGKDRTGIAVALVHLAAGVHRDDAIEDYLLTNSAGDVEARIRAGAETIAAMTGPVDEGVVRVLMGVEAEYLESALAAIEERSGSLDSYLAVELGADAELRARLRERPGA
jgi:protein tyrosine/serine phosphatase